MFKIIILPVMVLCTTTYGCFAMKYYLNDGNEINHISGYRPTVEPLPDVDAISLQDPMKSCFDRYPRYKALWQAIHSHDSHIALELIGTMTQEELNIDDCVGRTLLMIAIEELQETIAFALVEAMNEECLRLCDMEMCDALNYAYHYNMTNVKNAIEQKLRVR